MKITLSKYSSNIKKKITNKKPKNEKQNKNK